MHDVIVDAVFDVAGTIREVEEPLSVRIILREEQLGCAVTIEPPLAEIATEFDNVFTRAA